MATPSVLSADPKTLQSAFEKPSITASLLQLQKIINAAKLDLADFSDGLEYAGFDREKIAQLCAKRFGAKGTAKIILMGVKRGTRVDKILRSSIKMDQDIAKWFKDGALRSGGKGPEVVSVGRVLACFPDCAVLISQMYGVKSKLPESRCPVELQFPAAASLPMTGTVRTLHIEFCKEFGRLIKSPFNPDFYRIAFNSMVSVSQVDSRVMDVLGNPTDRESRAFDIEPIMESSPSRRVSVKGKERVVETSGSMSELQTRDDNLNDLFRG